MTINGEIYNGDLFVPLVKWAHQTLDSLSPVSEFSHIWFYQLPAATTEYASHFETHLPQRE